MKITFFKNEEDFYPRVSYILENAIWITPKSAPKYLSIVLSLLGPLLLGIYIGVNIDFYIGNSFFYDALIFFIFIFALSIFILPAHEFCHALGCWIQKGKVERICFFPNGITFKRKIAAYVKCEFTVRSKPQQLLFTAFPLLILTVIPIILALCFPQYHKFLILTALMNFNTAIFDIEYIIKVFSLPGKIGCIEDFFFKGTSNQPIVIHRLFVTHKRDRIYHEQFFYCGGHLTRLENPEETSGVRQVKQEFIAQFHL